MIPFEKITSALRPGMQQALLENRKGCEYSFTNMRIWGRQQAAYFDGYWVIFAQFDRKAVYPYPVGKGDIRPVLEAIIQDAQMRGIPCCITGLNRENVQTLELLYPGKFRFQCDRDSFDYVYNIDDLADLKGRKFQKKRNHLHRFHAQHPNCRVETLTPANMEAVQDMADGWYRHRQETDPQGNYVLEKAALARMFAHYDTLKPEGLVLMEDDRVLAFTIASFLSADTMDVHFEKALEDVDGAYPAINQAMAQYLREKYPQVRYLDREEDMGLEGLRQAKLSYHPDHMVEKYWARFWEASDEP